MVEATKREVELLIERGFLRCVAGEYPGLVVSSRRKKHGGKSRYVEDRIAYNLRYCQ